MKKHISLLIIGVLVLSGLGAVATGEYNTLNTLNDSETFSEPILNEKGEFLTVDLNEATSYKTDTGSPALPIVSNVYTFPIGTKIENVEVTFSDTHKQVLSKDVMPAPEPQYISTDIAQEVSSKPVRGKVYQSEKIYPEGRYTYRTGVGLKGSERVLYLSVHYCPITYIPKTRTMQVSDSIQIGISYRLPENPINFRDQYDLLILTVPEFADAVQPLIDYKNDHETATTLITLDEISSQGVDIQEDIKYCIKDAIDNWNVKYVLIVGAGVENEEIFPVRHAWIPSGGYEQYFPSDLYYADVYDASMNFATWDDDGDERYCEVPDDIDAVDVYPDVFIGRLPCNDVTEVTDIVNKIINFEEHNKVTERILQVGGDTFPGDDEGINEGEFANERVLEKLPGYTSTQCWASNNKLTMFNIILGMHKGVDFVDFSGHGSPAAWATHDTEDASVWLPKRYLIEANGFFYTDIAWMYNSKKHPVVVLNACSTSKFSATPNCLSWEYVKSTRGGAIATYGASGIGYGSSGSSETAQLFGWMEVNLHQEFYNNGVLGDSWGNSITNYTNTFEMEELDYKTVTELAQFADPSLALETGPDPDCVPVFNPILFKFLENLIERFPLAFPILRYILGL